MPINVLNKRILLLQGPLGPFFWRFANELMKNGAKEVVKINFNGGDELFFADSKAISYRGSLEDWPQYVAELLVNKQINCVFLLGDMRPYHRCMREITKQIGVDLFVFEEGYLRPDFITLERGGVNGNSTMPRDPAYYFEKDKEDKEDEFNLPVGKTFLRSALYAIIYMNAMAFKRHKYKLYCHHRDVGVLYHGLSWIRGWFRKFKYQFLESQILQRLQSYTGGGYFLFPLQVHNDYQFHHSRYLRIEECITEVIESFAKNAPIEDLLVIKHHPADRPYRDYASCIKELATDRHVSDRVLYVHDLHLPTLLKNARGTVLMNSTVGLSSVHHGTPVKVLGDAVYNFEGLTFQGALSDFWQDPGEVDSQVYASFRAWLLRHNQANGSFYRRLDKSKDGTGVIWFSKWL